MPYYRLLSFTILISNMYYLDYLSLEDANHKAAQIDSAITGTDKEDLMLED